MVEWVRVGKAKPRCSRISDGPGTQVLVWPPQKMEGAAPIHVAFYGTRQSDKPNFYIYGKIVFPLYWAKLPNGPMN